MNKYVLLLVSIFSIVGLLLGITIFSNVTQSKEAVVRELYIENHKFSPGEVMVPSGKKIILIVKNMDPTAEEFESDDLKREKIVPGNGTIKVILAPLKAGKYRFFGEFHEDTAQGVLVVVDENNEL